MIRRFWHEGSLPVGKARPLDYVRKTILSHVEGYGLAERLDFEVVELPDGVETGPGRLDLAFRWVDEGVPIACVLALQISPLDSHCVDWFLGAASAKPWRLTVLPPLLLLGLNEDLDAVDRAGLSMHAPEVLRCKDVIPHMVDQFADLVTGWVNDPERSIGFMVFPQERHPRNVGSLGLVTAISVDEIGRAALNERLPARIIPHDQARLFMPACDGLPDVVSTNPTYAVASPFITGLHQLLNNRQRTPWPERWRDNPQLQAWWTSDPFAPIPPAPAPETTDRDPVADTRLQEAVRNVTILRRQKGAIETALTEAKAANAHLLEQLAERVDSDALKAQLDAAQAEAVELAAALEVVEAERDALRRQNGLLVGRLAQAGASLTLTDEQDTRDFASFAELLDAAGSDLPGIVVTADRAPAIALDRHPKAPAWRRKAWDALITLHAYVRARTTGPAPAATHADVHTFARTGQPGSLISANIIKLGESETVTRVGRYREARVFPVGPNTDPEGRAFFGAHIALDRVGYPAPRIHFLDDVVRNGVLYIGYVGEHLPNTRTN